MRPRATLPFVSAPAEVEASDDVLLARRREALRLPAVVATCVAGVFLALSVLFGVVASVLLHRHPGWLTPNGATYVPPTHAQRVANAVEWGAPIVVGLVLIVATWWFRSRGLKAATYVAGGLAVLCGVRAVW